MSEQPLVQKLENPDPLGADTLARKWTLDVDVNYGISNTPKWVRIRGIQDQSPSEDPETQDSSTYDSGGWKSTAVTAMGWGWEITVARKTADGVVYDTGQEYLRQKSLRMGPANVAHIRAYEWNGLDGPRVQAYEGLVGVAYSEQGGDMTALSSAKITLSGQGRRIDTPHPCGPTAWQSSTPYVVGDQVLVADGSVLQATTAGTSGATMPTKTQLTDGSVTWKVVSTTP